MSHRPIGPARLAPAIALLMLLAVPLAAQGEGPTNVRVSGDPSGVTVTWTAGPKAVSYRVLRSANLERPGIDLTKPITAAAYLDRSADPRATYYYQVIAVYEDRSERPAAPVLFAPAQQTQLTLPPVVVAQVSLVPQTGLMLPLQEPLTPVVGLVAAEPVLVPLTPFSSCNPVQTLPGPGPMSFTAYGATPTMGVRWPPVPGAVAYVVERSVDGATFSWTLVGSTCGGPSPIRTVQYYQEPQPSIWVRDFSGGIVPGTKYVYKIKAIGAGGETGWNSTRWTAPCLRSPTWTSPTITGSTVVLKWTELNWYCNSGSASRYLVSSEYGWSTTQGGCASSCKVTVYGVPEGTHTFTVTSQWVDSSSPFPGGVYASVARNMSLTIRP